MNLAKHFLAVIDLECRRLPAGVRHRCTRGHESDYAMDLVLVHGKERLVVTEGKPNLKRICLRCVLEASELGEVVEVLVQKRGFDFDRAVDGRISKDQDQPTRPVDD